MSLPACERRVLHQMEGALRASEPHLAAMYAIFTKLNTGEPVGRESLPSGPLRRGPAVYAIVLFPVMFAMVVVGVLFSGSARGTTACGPSLSAARGAPLMGRASCPRATTQAPGTAQAREAAQARGAAQACGTTQACGTAQAKAPKQVKASTQVKSSASAVPASSASPKAARGDAAGRGAPPTPRGRARK